MKSKVYAYRLMLLWDRDRNFVLSETASAGAKKNSEEIKKLKGCSKVIRNKEIYYDDYDRILH